jgi:hypothetical protein
MNCSAATAGFPDDAGRHYHDDGGKREELEQCRRLYDFR